MSAEEVDMPAGVAGRRASKIYMCLGVRQEKRQQKVHVHGGGKAGDSKCGAFACELQRE